eukprot:TRINITY_DN8329_c0_g2_i3.p1 TRINITY_DN8329_c0_g2~~TRINITY_DN8329_c0_g2_i3.p1  ORF type:complete len:141 (-),score=14.54 TRINITY_DN8329_c0_g2_i3:380-802(-)
MHANICRGQGKEKIMSERLMSSSAKTSSRYIIRTVVMVEKMVNCIKNNFRDIGFVSGEAFVFGDETIGFGGETTDFCGEALGFGVAVCFGVENIGFGVEVMGFGVETTAFCGEVLVFGVEVRALCSEVLGFGVDAIGFGV